MIMSSDLSMPLKQKLLPYNLCCPDSWYEEVMSVSSNMRGNSCYSCIILKYTYYFAIPHVWPVVLIVKMFKYLVTRRLDK